jgi:hypothetical protein
MNTPSEYEFDQLVAEAVHRVGKQPIADFLDATARTVGWPIPPQQRALVGANLSRLVVSIEARRLST